MVGGLRRRSVAILPKLACFKKTGAGLADVGRWRARRKYRTRGVPIMGKVVRSFFSLPFILALLMAQAAPASSQTALQQQNKGATLLDQIRQQTNENVTTIISGN